MTIPQRSLGGTAKDIKVGAIGHGLMFLTWKPEHTPDEEAFESMKAAVDAGANFWNSATFYGMPDHLANLKLLRRFFDKYPEYAEPGKIFLSVKGGGGTDQSEDETRKELLTAIEALGPRKKIDLFELARQRHPVEQTMPVLVKLLNEGLFSHIGLSEVSASSIRRANAIYPVTAVEVEASLWALEPELYEVIKACEEFGIAIAAYSPLGRGFAGRKFKSRDDLPEGDLRRHFPKFSEENFPINLKITDALDKISAKRSVSTSQLALAYVLQLSDTMIPIPGSSNIKRTLENIESANVTLSAEELEEINKVVAEFPNTGARYGGPLASLIWA